MPTITRPFDMAEQLGDGQDIAAYLTLMLEEGDPGELAHALGVIASLRFETILKVMHALGLRISVQPAA